MHSWQLDIWFQWEGNWNVRVTPIWVTNEPHFLVITSMVQQTLPKLRVAIIGSGYGSFFEKSFCSAYMVFIRVGGLALAIKLKQQLGYDNFTVRPYLDPRISCYYSCVSVCRFSRKRKTLAEHGECVIASLCWHSGLRNWCLYIWLLQDNIYPVSRVPL